jgi:hypothetical protein
MGQIADFNGNLDQDVVRGMEPVAEQKEPEKPILWFPFFSSPNCLSHIPSVPRSNTERKSGVGSNEASKQKCHIGMMWHFWMLFLEDVSAMLI